ncbi:hypothetical protein A500_20113 [Clostridium sartagoforme AAU1]|uniref:Uncharacterized protein n=1 Tax=Clostridium sartagoforme AAU1 TaxID=1202534 RepID=R9BRN5_9CLOT|nr:hypothetical protein A500_20113 [Clostridium sartagoforme AAU1]
MPKQILVAPYWNVNITIFEEVDFRGSILVAPYWNVNDGNAVFNDLEIIILVAPYWNVNLFISLSYDS